MKLLLDTHAFLWYITNNPKLPRYAYDAIRDKSNEAFLRVVSVWEVLVKHKIGKLPLPAPADDYMENRRTAHRIADLTLDSEAVSHLLSLPEHHRDPFDRMLICQALQYELTIVTNDEMFRRYPVPVLAPT
ncbi:MAG TPA: type II toxin-antitoxin system VapC family toxin [Thermoanaerobaculia bacterium]|nr:type II toxin-antitoxin system VapC family toxin [Thermoanaerobaculia bacterium]